MQAAIRLFPSDNILVLARSHNAEEEIQVGGVAHILNPPLVWATKLPHKKLLLVKKSLNTGRPLVRQPPTLKLVSMFICTT